ncbi:aminotransferase class I/II-fold pyridoxal phosphate-dependent enzyme [Candidatus Parcubacteria bacterium]|nr:aminotransferase class I/II-fold pyridoxal phosphate-dependent enzyme [Candidatus Parcubacteria bacterium]
MKNIPTAARIDMLEESATLALNARVKQMAEQGKPVYNLTAGELPCKTPEYISDYVATKLDENKYTPASGLPVLKLAIAEAAKNFYGFLELELDNVVVTAGLKPAIYASLLSVINPGDEVLVPIPGWTSYSYQIKLAGGTPIEVELDENFDLDIGAIKQKITSKTKAVILCSPNNPTGTIYSKQRLEELAGVLNAAKIVVLSDDIYSKLVFSEDYAPPAKCGFLNLVILGGFSKSQALTGWRIGYIIAPNGIASAANKVLSQIMGNASLPAQYAAIAALENNDQPVMMAELLENRKFIINQLNQIEKIDFKEPHGAFYIYLDIRKITKNSLDWCEKLLNETGVALVPGEAFYTPGFARLNFAANKSILQTALNLLKDFNYEESKK